MTTEPPAGPAPHTDHRPSKTLSIVAYTVAVLAPIVSAGVYYRALDHHFDKPVAAGFPLDDSWIHAQYARTFVEGRPLEYVPGEVSIGTTSLLFDVVWAAATSVTGEYVYTIYAVNLACTCVLAVLLVAMLVRFGVPVLIAGIGSALIVSSYPFPWSTLSGMETALAALLTTAAVFTHMVFRTRGGWRAAIPPVLMALAAMTRPENLILYPLSEIDRLLVALRRPGESRSGHPVARFAIRLAAFALTLAPYVAVNMAVHGAPVPNTYAAKVGSLDVKEDIQAQGTVVIADRFRQAWEVIDSAFLLVWGDDNPALIALAAVGLLFVLVPRRQASTVSEASRRIIYATDVVLVGVTLACMMFVGMPGRELPLFWRLVALACLEVAAVVMWFVARDGPPVPDSLLPVLVFVGGAGAAGVVTMGVFFPGQSQRYLIQWIPLILVYGVVGLYALARCLTALTGLNLRVAETACVVLVLVGHGAHVAFHHEEHVNLYVTSVKNINEMQVELGKWVDRNTPPDAVIATNDIGAIAFFGNRPIVDTIGLIDPEVVRRKHAENSTKLMLDYLEQRGVTHAILFPSWHPDLLLDEHFIFVHRVALDDNVICGDAHMIVAETHWKLPDQRPEPPAWAAEEINSCESALETIKAFFSL